MQKILLLLFLLTIQQLVFAQDSHYWSNQYGARASFLGGAVIAGLDDNSAVYYNPANLVFIKQSTVSLNTSVYKYANIFIGNGAGQNVDLQSQKISLYQQMVSGLLTKNPEKHWRMAFNILARQNTSRDIKQHHEGDYHIINAASHPGMEHYIANIELRNSLNETWACLGVGFKISENFSAGITGIVSYRNQKHTLSNNARAYSADSAAIAAGLPLDIANNTTYVDTRTNIIGGLLKAGFHGRIGHWRFGLNITSPSLTFWGESRVQRENSKNNIPDQADEVRIAEQTNLKSTYKYPLSIGTGITYLYKKGLITFSAEYFMGVPQYKMIESNPSQSSFLGFASPDKDFLTVHHGADQVINFAMGWEQELITKVITLHIGFRSDFSYAKKNNRIKAGDLKITSAPIDLWHFSSGISWRRKSSLMSIGVNYAYGHRDKGYAQLINFTNPTEEAPYFLFSPRDESAYINYHSITLMIGYTYYFKLK